MKNLRLKSVVLFIFALVLFTSCKKNHREPSVEPQDNAIGQNEGGEGSITAYQVKGNKIVKIKDFDVSGKELEFQKDKLKHDAIWDLVVKIIPIKYLNKLSEFYIFAGENDGTAGYVTNPNQDLSKWRMGIAIDFAFLGGFNTDNLLTYTIIHEYGHVLSLNDEQVNGGESGCSTYAIEEGCTKNTSYLNVFYNRFWADIFDEFKKELAKEGDNMNVFYQKYQDRFLTPYAASNPVEDFAEVFAYFITQKNRPSGITMAEKKVLLLYEYPELLAIRSQIRENLGSGYSRSINLLPNVEIWKNSTFKR